MNLHVDLYLHCTDGEVLRRLDSIAAQVSSLTVSTNQRNQTIMASLEDVLDDVKAETTQIEGISTLVTGLKQQVADALAGTTLPPAVQAKVDAVFAGLEANKGAIAGVLAAGTPTDPGTPIPAVVDVTPVP